MKKIKINYNHQTRSTNNNFNASFWFHTSVKHLVRVYEYILVAIRAMCFTKKRPWIGSASFQICYSTDMVVPDSTTVLTKSLRFFSHESPQYIEESGRYINDQFIFYRSKNR